MASIGNLHFTLPFTSRNGINYHVDIYDTNYNGEVIALKGAPVPFDYENNSNDMFAIINGTSGYLRVLIENAETFNALKPASYTDKYIELVSEKQPYIQWQGFLSAESFESEFKDCPFILELPVLSLVSVLDMVNYRFINERTTFGHILQHVFGDIIPVRSDLWCYFPDLKISGASGECTEMSYGINDSIYAHEDNSTSDYVVYDGDYFKDKEEVKCSEIITDICTTFGYKLCDSMNRLIFSASDVTSNMFWIPLSELTNISYFNKNNCYSDHIFEIDDVIIPTLKYDANNINYMPPVRYCEVLTEQDAVSIMDSGNDTTLENFTIGNDRYYSTNISRQTFDTKDWLIPTQQNFIYIKCDVEIQRNANDEWENVTNKFVPLYIRGYWNSNLTPASYPSWGRLERWNPNTKIIGILLPDNFATVGKIKFDFYIPEEDQWYIFGYRPYAVRLNNVEISFYAPNGNIPDYIKEVRCSFLDVDGDSRSFDFNLTSTIGPYCVMKKSNGQWYNWGLPSIFDDKRYTTPRYLTQRVIRWYSKSKIHLNVTFLPDDWTNDNNFSLGLCLIDMRLFCLGKFLVSKISRNPINDEWKLESEEINE